MSYFLGAMLHTTNGTAIIKLDDDGHNVNGVYFIADKIMPDDCTELVIAVFQKLEGSHFKYVVVETLNSMLPEDKYHEFVDSIETFCQSPNVTMPHQIAAVAMTAAKIFYADPVCKEMRELGKGAEWMFSELERDTSKTLH